MKELIPVEIIEKKIYLIRGHKVMLDRDLAELYGVETRVLNQAVRRNLDRFPEDFMFALSREEIMNLSQIVISSRIKHAPNVFVFPEQGSGHAFGCAEQRESNSGEYSHNEDFCEASGNAVLKQGTCSQVDAA